MESSCVSLLSHAFRTGTHRKALELRFQETSLNEEPIKVIVDGERVLERLAEDEVNTRFKFQNTFEILV